MSDNSMKEYNEGFDAALRGRSVEANPYRVDWAAYEFKRWSSGHNEFMVILRIGGGELYATY